MLSRIVRWLRRIMVEPGAARTAAVRLDLQMNLLPRPRLLPLLADHPLKTERPGATRMAAVRLGPQVNPLLRPPLLPLLAHHPLKTERPGATRTAAVRLDLQINQRRGWRKELGRYILPATKIWSLPALHRMPKIPPLSDIPVIIEYGTQTHVSRPS